MASGKVVDIRQGQKANHRPNTAQSRHKKGSGQNHKAGSRNNTQANTFQDYSLIFVLLFLLAFGLVMLYSTSSYEAGINYGDSAYYLKRQLVSTSIGLLVMLGVAQIPYRVYMPWVWLFYALSVVLVVLVVFIGREVNGAKRWIYVGPVSVQPAEIAKIAVILVTAFLLCTKKPDDIKGFKGMIRVLWPAIVQFFAIWRLNNNMSTAFIVLVIAVGMYFIANPSLKGFLIVGGIAVVGVIGVIIFIQTYGADGMNFRFSRIEAWLDPTKYADGIGFQTVQALYGIGSGGIFGKGLGESMQKLGYIPEAQNDMIFSIICEELGLFGAVSIIVLFIILCWRFRDVAQNAQDMFGGLIASGVMIHIAVQVILNIAVVTNTIPNTGVTLPFISYGGTSIVILLSEIGIVLNIARYRRRSGS